MLSCLEKGENTPPTFQTVMFEGATDHMNHKDSQGTLPSRPSHSVHLVILSSTSLTTQILLFFQFPWDP